MTLSEQIRKHRQNEGLSLTELARLSRVSKGYLSHLENDLHGPRPSADVLYRIATALGTSVHELLGKQADNNLDDLPAELRAFASDENLPEEEIALLARIEYRGRRPRTVADWRFLYEAIKRSVQLED